MLAYPDPEPDEQRLVIYVGPDAAGHRLVQDSAGKLEGRFVSRSAALGYAEAERQIYHAALQIAATPLMPMVPFAPVAASDRARRIAEGRSMNAHLLAPWSPEIRRHQLSAGLAIQARIADNGRRWREVVSVLEALLEEGRHAVRIVDADCGIGLFLLHAVRHARSLGFTAIEGRGIDGSPALIAYGRAAALCYPDPAVGLVYEVADAARALREESDGLPADIVLWHGGRPRDLGPEITNALRAAGDVVVADHFTFRRKTQA